MNRVVTRFDFINQIVTRGTGADFLRILGKNVTVCIDVKNYLRLWDLLFGKSSEIASCNRAVFHFVFLQSFDIKRPG